MLRSGKTDPVGCRLARWNAYTRAETPKHSKMQWSSFREAIGVAEMSQEIRSRICSVDAGNRG
jgi:hypothetical protein